jgi:hypothetical protein
MAELSPTTSGISSCKSSKVRAVMASSIYSSQQKFDDDKQQQFFQRQFRDGSA